MTEYIYIKCPRCHSEYEISLDVVSAGKSKAKCGKCHNSFVIKENMINHSFLHDSSTDNGEYEVVDSNSSDQPYRIDPENPAPAYAPHLNDSDIASINEDNEYGKEWSSAINEMAQDSFIDESAYVHDYNESPNLSLNYDNTGSARTLSTELNHAPPYYDSTNEGIIDPIKHSLNTVKKPPENKLNKSYSPYIMPALWAIGCVGLLLLLLAQYIVFNLDRLVKDPNPPINVDNICRVAACALPSADLTQITLSNQQFRPSTQRPGTTAILATITNRSSQEQFYPNMKVQVYGLNGIIGDFIAKPEDYLLTPQRLIRNAQPTTFMLTVDIDPDTINRVEIEPFY